jgi:uncharacterized protein YacL
MTPASMALRGASAAALALVGWQLGSVAGAPQPRNALLGIGVGAVTGAVAAPMAIKEAYLHIKRSLTGAPLGDVLYGIVGLVLGLVVAALLSYPLSFLPWWFGHVLPAVAAVVFAYLGISLMLMRRRELTHALRTQFAPDAEEHPGPGYALIDTSAIIDGRIADISETGFLRETLVVPRFVLKELQHIADSADPLRRNRGKRGFEILTKLQKSPAARIEIADIDAGGVPDVDGKLVQLARQMHAPVITNDFNLNRVAELQGVRVLNINQLANALKPMVLPGEEMAVHIIQEGKEFNQGVGYLDDGTMIVVENGRAHLNREIDIVVTRVLQTVAGRMIFAHPKNNGRT